MLVGHSGAGPLLPPVADTLAMRPAQLVFVDAGVPPSSGDAALVPDELAAHLVTLANGYGLLPRWSEWFGADAMRTLVPDDDVLAEIVAELPQLPLSYFHERVPMPDAWTVHRAAYILCSDPYREDAAEAAARGWPITHLPGTHLDIVTRPLAIADTLETLTSTPR